MSVSFSKIGLAVLLLTSAVLAEETSIDPREYAPVDADLKVVLLDSSPDESFLSMKLDSAGRLFVGGREGLFVYEPGDETPYQPRKELYRFPPHSWVYDIEIRGADLYVLTLNALYIFENGVTQRENLKPKLLLWGVPAGHVHQCFHSLAWGPEGDLYLSMGDPLWYYGDFNRPDHWGHWTFYPRPEGTEVPYTGVGGVFRLKPDGSHFQVVARGLRNSCGLAFDRHWNLFTNDNDHEGMPSEYVPGRLNYVTPHSDFSWPRGWMLSKTPDRMDMLDTMFEGMGRAVPVGQSYYDDDYLPAKYRNSLLVARWCTRQVTFYPLKPRGASFVTEEFPLINGENLARPVGVTVGRGGRIFTTISYMAHNEGSPIYRSDLAMITRKDDPANAPFEAYDHLTATDEKLFDELKSTSWTRRRLAHTELIRRGPQIADEAIRRFRETPSDAVDFPHLMWIASAATDDDKVDPKIRIGRRHFSIIERLTQPRLSTDASIIVQQLRVLTEFFPTGFTLNLWPAFLKHDDRQVRHAAVLQYFADDDQSCSPLLHFFANNYDDAYLRQSTAIILAEREELELFSALCRSTDSKNAENEAYRMLGTLAVGFRLTMPPVHAKIPEHLPLTEWRVPEETLKIVLADRVEQLPKTGRVGVFTLAEHWNAAPHTDEQEQLFQLLAERLEDDSEAIRLQAAHFLYLLNDPRTEPKIALVRKDIEQNRLNAAPLVAVNELWAIGPFADGDAGFDTIHPPQTEALDVTKTYRVGDNKVAWKKMKTARMFDLGKEFSAGANSSCYAFCRLESAKRQQVMLLVGSDDGIQVWHNGALAWTNDVTRAALPLQDIIYLTLEPGSNDLLFRVRNRDGEAALFAHYRTLTDVPYSLPDPVDGETLAERLKSAANTPEGQLAEAFLKLDWIEEAKQGDAAKGEKLFSADGIGCAKCHAIKPDAEVQGGPSLAQAAKRFTIPHLVESILLPSRQVSPVFRATTIVTTEGQVLTGLVINETNEKLELLTTEAKRVTLTIGEIEDRKPQELSPMPAGVVKTPGELRDLLAYLLGG
ncbi:MAG: c-type cytochrome [Planctomycetota bacterium]|nr:c-type cytochrome [Planctomycetota bacterium]MDA1211614.1 c-type cytochrome [Planctomycetota bacterium]